MEIKTFLTLFEKNMCQMGFSKESAYMHTTKIAKSLSPSDRARISSIRFPEEVSSIAAGYIKRLHTAATKNAAEATKISKISNAKNTGAVSERDLHDVPARSADSTQTISTNFNKAITKSKESDNIGTVRVPAVKKSNDALDVYNNYDEKSATRKVTSVMSSPPKVELTAEGKRAYTKWVVSHLHIMIAEVVGIGTFAFVTYAIIASLITFFVLLLSAITVIGIVAGLAGFVYGIIKLFSVLPEGIYEIGLSVIILGVTLALCICSYNIAVRFIPKLWKKFTGYLKQKNIRLKIYNNKIRTECNEQ